MTHSLYLKKKILDKETLSNEERLFLTKKINIEKKLMGGKYQNIQEMATDINDRKPSKEIEKFIFRNMMKIMLNEFNN